MSGVLNLGSGFRKRDFFIIMIHQIVSHKFIVLCLSILAAIPFLIRIPEVKTVDNVDYFAIENDRDVVFYEEMKTIFGNDEFFIIAFKKDNLFTAKHLGLLKKLTEGLADINGTGFLIIEKAGYESDQFLYLPALRRSRRIVSSQKSHQFVNSDFTYEDIERHPVENYIYDIKG
ncbi:MAG: outer membrane lipoprotein-sorting protein, partial [Bacteroidota bacterium]